MRKEVKKYVTKGAEYNISITVSEYFNSAEKLTIIRNSDEIIQFSLENGKGHGAMPIQHFQSLLKKKDISYIPSKRSLITENEEEQQIG